MNKNSKIALSVLVLAGLLLISSYWYFGNKIKQRFDDGITDFYQQEFFKQNNNFKVDIKELKYQQGFFSSYARHEITLTLLKDKFALIIENDINHGPIIFADGNWELNMAVITSKLVSNENLDAWFNQNNNQTPMIVKTAISLNGKSNSNIQLLPYQSSKDNKRKGNFSITFGKLNADFMINPGAQKTLNLTLDKFFIGFKPTKHYLDLHGLNSVSTENVIDENNLNSNSRQTIKRIDVLLPNVSKTIEYVDVVSNADAQVKQNILSYKVDTKFNNINVRDVKSEEAIELGSIDYALDINNINLAPIKEFLNNPQQQALPAIFKLAGDLLEAKPIIKLGPIVWTDKQNLTSKITIDAQLQKYADIPLKSFNANLKLSTPMLETFLNKIFASINDLPKEEVDKMVGDVIAKLTDKLENSIFVKNENDLLSNLEANRNDSGNYQIKLNNQPIELKELELKINNLIR